MADYTLDTLIKDLQRNTYIPKTDAELQAAATNRYQGYYDQQRLVSQQGYDTTNLALGQQAKTLDQLYNKQLGQSATNYAQTYSQAGRGMLQRGMQRSSYGGQIQGGIAIAGNKAQDEIMGNKALAIGGVEDQRTLLARQLADQLKQYSASQGSDILSYIDELEAKEYDKGTASTQYNNSLASQIYGFQQQENAAKTQQEQWSKSFDESTRQFNSSLTEQQASRAQTAAQWQAEFNNQQSQFGQNLSEEQRQFNAQLALNTSNQQISLDQFNKELAEKQKQFNESLALNTSSQTTSADQWAQEFAQKQLEYNASVTPVATSNTGSGKLPGDDGKDKLWATQGFPDIGTAQKSWALKIYSYTAYQKYLNGMKPAATNPSAVASKATVTTKTAPKIVKAYTQ